VDEVYSEIYGVHLPHNPNYSPLSREGVNRDEEAGLGEFLKEMPFRASATTAGGLKSRTANTYPIAKRADVQVLMEHVVEMEHFRAWAKKIRDLNAVFSNPRVRQSMRINWGPSVDKVVQSFIQDFARGGAELARNMNWLDRLRSSYTRSVLAVKPSILIKQLTSFIAYADAIPVAAWAKGLPKSPGELNEAINTLMQQSTMMRDRWEQGAMERDIKTAMNSAEWARWRSYPSFWNMLMVGIKIGDAGAIIYGGWPVYKHYLKQTGSHAQALRAFESITESTQQSGDLSEQSYWQRGSSFAKIWTMFLSSPNQYLRKEIGALRNLAAGRTGPIQFAKTMLIFHILLPMFFQWVSDRFTWDEDEQRRAVIMGSLNGFFIMGDALDALVRAALGMQVFEPKNPLWSVWDDMAKALPLIDPDHLDAEDFVRALRGLAGAGGALTGMPLKQLVDIGTGYSDILSGEYEAGIAELAGWSPYIAHQKAEDKR